MRGRMRWNGLVLTAVLAVCVVPLAAQMQEPVDFDAIYKIKDEGLNRSQVMDIMSWLTDVHGPRLTNSPVTRAAADWAVKKMQEWGLANAKIEPWASDFGRGWTNERFFLQVTAPVPFAVIGTPVAWTPGTNGKISCEVILVRVQAEGDLDKLKGTLKDKCVMYQPMRAVPAQFEPQGERYTDKQLEELEQQPIRTGAPAGGPQAPNPQAAQQFQLQQRLTRMAVEEGVALLLTFSARGDGGTLFVGGGPGRNASDPAQAPRVVIAIEHYGRIYRTLEKKIPVMMEAEITNKFYDQDLKGYNVVAELPGSDKADELVMVGAHFDSWHGGTGATDNAAGSAVMMEVMRILKATGLKLRRTVRIGLWNGEEQGLIGSREYVTAHFADRADMKLKPEHAKLSAYYNIDNGTGKVRGVYLQGNEAVAPIFRAWMEPFRNMGMTTLTIRNTGGTDHLSFDRVGLPGFQFIQDEVEYETRTHHTNMDTYERIQEADMKQMAVIVASFVYHTANRPALLPRKPLPPPQPAQPPGQQARPGGAPPPPQRPD